MQEQSFGRLHKREGSYYTPHDIVRLILDIAGYVQRANGLPYAYVIDPSAGDGAILVETVRRYIASARRMGWSDDDIHDGIIEHVFAFEINEGELEKCKQNVSKSCEREGVAIGPDELSHFFCGDAFDMYKHYMGFFDYVVGNPPYVRIHNLDRKPDSRYVKGMCDLFYPFFDIGQQMLRDDNGILCYIAPSSWFTSSSGKNMRQDLRNRNVVSAICDFGHYQVFSPNAFAYTAIVKLSSASSNYIDLYDVDVSSGNVSYYGKVLSDTCWVDGSFLPGCPSWIDQIMNTSNGAIKVRNGYATNLDNVFVSSEPRFSNDIERIAVKASTCSFHHILYPYDENGNLLSFDDIERKCPQAARFLTDNKHDLLKRSQINDDLWWAFGRSQGISDTFKQKIALQSLVKPGEKVRCAEAPCGCGVYGGVYVLGADFETVDSAVNSMEFIEYAKCLRKYKSGGYYALGGKDIERFLNWYVTMR